MKHLSRVSAAPFLRVGGEPENNLHIGSSWEFQFAGKPGTFYIWKLDGAASHGLDVVKLKSLGYASRKPGSTLSRLKKAGCRAHLTAGPRAQGIQHRALTVTRA